MARETETWLGRQRQGLEDRDKESEDRQNDDLGRVRVDYRFPMETSESRQWGKQCHDCHDGENGSAISFHCAGD